MKTILPTAALFALAACAAPEAPQAAEPAPAPQTRAEAPAAPTLAGEWRIAELGGQTLPADARARISFDAARSVFNGSAGCNSLFGSYQADGASLKFGDTASTLMACEPALMKREQALSSALRRTAAYEFDNGALVFKNKQGKTLLKAVK